MLDEDPPVMGSPQGPPVHSPETHSSASIVGGDPPEVGAAQQQQHCPLMLDLPPASHLQASTAKHVPATAFDRAAALAEQQEGISGSAALEQQQQQQTIQTLCCL